MNEELFLEPHKSYKELSSINEKEINDFFNALVEKSEINVEENKATVKKINETTTKINEQSEYLRSKKSLKTFVVTLSIITIVASVITILIGLAKQGSFLYYLIPGLLIAAAIFFIVFINKKINPIIKSASETLEKLEKEKEELIKLAYSQVAPLCNLFDWNMSNKIFSKTIPLIDLDDSFNVEQFQFLHDKYGFEEDTSKTKSALFVQSGTILGNPFLIKRDLEQTWGMETYTGTLVIHWTTTTHDKNGTHIHHHTQTLVATVEKPIPRYSKRTTLIYGNEAASKLSFSRYPQNLSFKNQKEEDKYMRKFDKELDELTQKAISKGTQFQRMTNEDFEAYFHALDRDNNVEFRLLFTPLAQQNMLSLLKSKEPFGDDFSFIKTKKLNSVSSEHSQYFDYSGNPQNYYSYDYEVIAKQFIDYNKTFFKYLYYDFCPLMSIPLYQQTKATKYIYGEDYETNVTSYETEVLANSYDPLIFKNPKGVTEQILKREFVEKDDGTDYDIIHSYSYEAVSRVEFVSVFGGDGRFHNVPVNWNEYLPVQKSTKFSVQKCNSSRQKFDNCYRNGILDSFLALTKNSNGIMYQRGLLSLLNKDDQKFDGKALNNLLDKDKED